MDFFDEINSLDFIYLNHIEEPADNEVTISIIEASAKAKEEDLIIGEKLITSARPIVSNPDSRKYSFYFETYVAYSVTNESVTIIDDENEKRVGRLFSIYSKSNYLEYVRKSTIAEFYYGTDNIELKHYGIYCLNHSIDIISVDEPIIKYIVNKF